MQYRLLPVLALTVLACEGGPDAVEPPSEVHALGMSASRAGGSVVVSFPEEDPGAPFYARVTTLMNQIFHDDLYVAIPFYRDPDCVPTGFDLLQSYDFPDGTGPGAFGCPLTVTGHFLIEPDAPEGTFPIRVVSKGPTPVWFVEWAGFQDATADGDLTMAELLALNPLRGIARTFNEMLAPRMDDHHVVITSRGELEDGRPFQFNLNHRGDRTQSILIRIGARGGGAP